MKTIKYTSVNQGLNQDSVTGCPKLPILKNLGVLFFKGDHQYTQITTINMCLFPEIRQNTLIQFHGIYVGVKIINVIYLVENDILRNCSHKILGVQRGAFEGLGVQIHPDTVLAKTTA